MDYYSREDITTSVGNLVGRLIRDGKNPNEFTEEIHARIESAIAEKGWTLWIDGIWRNNYDYQKAIKREAVKL
ncbi:MAG: SPP1 phage holin family protein [Dehalococcoidia bacterium]|nr:SPP1 phage holin family protein [Dehalococcoidia bacterium]